MCCLYVDLTILQLKKVHALTEFELILLHPDHFSPFEHPVVYKIAPDKATPSSYAFAYVRDGVLLRADGSPYALPGPPSRTDCDRLNVFFIILNAFEKFRYHKMLYGFGNFSDDTLRKIAKTNHTIDLILFKPVPLPQSASLVRSSSSLSKTTRTMHQLLRW